MTATTSKDASPSVTVRCQFCDTWNRVLAERIADRPRCGKCARPMLLDRPWPLDDASFDRTVESSTVPVLVDFYAAWCGPCKMMAPAVDELAAKHIGKALVAKLDTDRSPATAQRFRIMGVPTTIVFSGGRETARQSGAIPLAALEELLTTAN